MSEPIFSFPTRWGFPVEIDKSILLLGFLFLMLGMSGDPVYTALLFVVLVLSILLHELGHAWGCLVQGVPVRRVVLHGGGGFMQPARSLSAHEGELCVAMGPIVNAVLWAVCGLATHLVASPMLYAVLVTVSVVNFILLVMNLLPVTPLDGGKLLYSVLTRFVAQRAAMQITGFVGLIMVILWLPLMLWAFATFGFVMLFFPNPMEQWRMARCQT